MKFSCPHCSQHMEADAAWAGQKMACPTCGQEFAVPSTAVAETTPVPPPPPTAKETLANAPAIPSARRRWLVGFATLSVLSALAWIAWRVPLAHRILTQLRPIPIQSFEVFPKEVTLRNRNDFQSVVVQATLADGSTREITELASFSLKNRSLATVENHRVRPVADGTTDLTIRYGGQEKHIPVEVRSASVESPLRFRMDVMPVLMKAGCNSGGCHGASRGKEGFHLSLFGYDPDGDYEALTHELAGRRINLAIPEESLILEKAIAKVPHGGGERFKTNSPLYRTLLQWLAAGAPKDSTNTPRVARLDLLPKQAVLTGKDSTQRLTLKAYYTDGTDRDVTPLAVFFSNNDGAARVSEEGVITAGQRGEAFVMARFESHTVGSQVIVVPEGSVPDLSPIPQGHYIDELVAAKLRKLRITASDVCDDATFIRRAYLDIIGTLPTPEETREFVRGMSTGKREQCIDSLLGRKEFVDLWVMKFAELLQIRSVQDQFSYKAALQYYDWLHDQLTANVPIDQIVQQLLTGSGSTFQHPEGDYYQLQTDTLKLAENTAQVFMGMRIQCAQCHNHPFDRWSMNDYYGFASFFARVGRKPGEDPREVIIYDRNDGEIKHPVGGRVMTPKFLGGVEPTIPAESSRRAVLARWIASPENPYFAKNLANMVWAHFLGKGIIDPVDDVRVSNPASNPELLDALGAKFTEYHYDFRKLVRDICTSKTYQRASQANDSNRLDDRNFAKASVRRLRAEVLLDIVTQVTETKDKFQGLPRGAKAVEIPDGNVNNYFLRTFGRATRNSVCSCEVRTEPNLSQALHLLNGATLQEKMDKGGVVKRLLKEGLKPAAVVDELYLRCLARPPTDEERTKLMTFLKPDKDPALVLNDVFWALLNAKEFVFNH